MGDTGTPQAAPAQVSQAESWEEEKSWSGTPGIPSDPPGHSVGSDQVHIPHFVTHGDDL